MQAASKNFEFIQDALTKHFPEAVLYGFTLLSRVGRGNLSIAARPCNRNTFSCRSLAEYPGRLHPDIRARKESPRSNRTVRGQNRASSASRRSTLTEHELRPACRENHPSKDSVVSSAARPAFPPRLASPDARPSSSLAGHDAARQRCARHRASRGRQVDGFHINIPSATNSFPSDVLDDIHLSAGAIGGDPGAESMSASRPPRS